MSREYSYRSQFNSEDWTVIFYIAFVILLIVLCLIRPLNKVSNIRETTTVTVTDKAIKNNGDDGKYLVFTEDANGNIEVFEITDSLLKGRFNSSDVYAAIKVDETYIFTVGGSRNEFLSWYPNIYEYELIESSN